jgi:hypothetical protein
MRALYEQKTELGHKDRTNTGRGNKRADLVPSYM